MITKSTQIGTRENETRATFIVNETVLQKIKAMAYSDRVQIRDITDRAFNAEIIKYEAENGPIQEVGKK